MRRLALARRRIIVGLLGAFVFVAGAAAGEPPEQSSGLIARGGGPLGQHDGPCIQPHEEAAAREALEEHLQTHGPFDRQVAGFPPDKFPFYPMGGRLYRDLFTVNFNDLDPGPGILDWDCTDYTYNGHDATDVDLRTFTEQEIGVPIFAVLDGQVVAAHDGEDDHHTSCFGTANYVMIDHGDSRVCRYWHMRRNSVAVSVGQIVKAGEQIGFTASSGCSTGPHLHFATYDSNVQTEPYTGSCNPGESQWIDQTPIHRDTYLRDFNITDENIGAYPGLPFDIPRTGTFVQGFQNVYFWVNLMNMESGSLGRIQFRRPNLSIALDTGTFDWGNPFYRWAWWWWSFGVNLNMTGTWHILFDVNGFNHAVMPFDVVASANDIVNRPPNAVSISLDPPAPTEDDTVFCLVDTDLLLDDRDYDVVRYRYLWQVNGQVVRDLVSAGHADAIPHHPGPPGSQIKCTVTPSDGIDDGPVASAEAFLPCPDPCLPFSAVDGGSVQRNRTLGVIVPGSVSATAGPGGSTAVGVTMVKLQNPQPPNALCCPPPDFSTFEAGAGCTDAAGCTRWVGPPATFLESQDDPAVGSYRAARLQCTPFYHDWAAEGLFHIIGAEVLPSSRYEIRNYDDTCVGIEDSCTLVSPPIELSTARHGDVAALFNPPSSTTQPDALDIAALVNKFKVLPGSPSKVMAQLQPNVPDANGDITALDISGCVDAFKLRAYPFTGPCNCPSTVTCGTTPCATNSVCGGGLCVKTCTSGPNAGLPCNNSAHCGQCTSGVRVSYPCDADADCPGSTCTVGICGAGFCRDGCARCSS